MPHQTRERARSRGGRLAGLAVLVATLAAAIAGCGGEDASVAVAEAAERTAATDSAAVTVEGTLEGTGIPEPVRFAGSGVVDNEAQTGRLEFEEFDIPGASGLPSDAFQGEVVFDDLTIYMRFPALLGNLPGGKQWMKLDLSEALGSQGVDLGQLTQVSQSNPTDSLRQLAAVSDDLEEVGEEDVGGVPTTHYEATVDLNRYPDVVPEDQRAATEESVANLIELTGTETIPVEVWIDDEGLVRRLSQSYSYETPDTGEVSQSQTVEFSDFGGDVDVEPPPAKDVFDATDIASQAPLP
jgi:hypothetical protein